jgi:hypothetical protein
VQELLCRDEQEQEQQEQEQELPLVTLCASNQHETFPTCASAGFSLTSIVLLVCMLCLSIPLSSHASLGRDIVEADSVHAVALVSGRGEALSFEDMAKVRAAVVAQNFNPSSIRVGLLLKISLCNKFVSSKTTF